jgi:hypothetical protein
MRGLPPLVAGIKDGSVTWQRIEAFDYESLGYFLSCHLIIEHYLDEYLKVCYRALDWDAARPTFGQKIALLTKFKVSERFDCVPAIKHMNSLRNKLSHDIEFKITADALLPLVSYLSKASEGKETVPTDPKEILEHFTTMTCVLFAGAISGTVSESKLTRA